MLQTQSHNCDNLILDGNNLCYINFFGNKEADEEDFLGLTFSGTLSLIRNVYKKFNPKNIVITFDSHSWRKEYTKRKELCITHKMYKGTRRNNLDLHVKRKMDILEKEINFFSDTLKNHTSFLVLQKRLLEGDDLIAGFVHKHKYEKNIIVSSDKDFMQLINHQTQLYNPVSEEFRTLIEHNNDYNYFLFEKCIRGDSGDNVISSYPRLRKTKIQEAFVDDFKKNNIMNNVFEVEELIDGNIHKFTYKTLDLFEENKFLMSLYDQPDEIKQLIDETIDFAIETRSKFKLFEFLKFCSKYNMVNTIKFADQLTPILNLKVI